MTKFEKIIEFSKKLPGFHGFRPYFDDGDIHVQELIFRLQDIEKIYEYTLTLFMNGERVEEGIIDVRDSDFSIVQIHDDFSEFRDIIEHKEKIIRAINALA